jgi:hypothetical protein
MVLIIGFNFQRKVEAFAFAYAACRIGQTSTIQDMK